MDLNRRQALKASLALGAVPASLAGAKAGPAGEPRRRLLMILLDDVDDQLLAESTTPTLDMLRAQSVFFDNFWAEPICGPTRAAMLTGQYPFQNGMGSNPRIGPYETEPASSLAVALAQGAGVRSAWCGKWHMSTLPDHALRSGFEYFGGSLASPPSYFDWNKAINGVLTPWSGYLTTDTADDTIRALNDGFDFVVCSFNAPHSPHHTPPAHLHTRTDLGDIDTDPRPYAKAMLEGADTELGRVLRSTDLRNTMVIVLADNGASTEIGGEKGTVREKGINVPMFIAGTEAMTDRGTVSKALVSVVDIFSTVCEYFGCTGTPDSRSLLPIVADHRARVRRYIYSERFKPNTPTIFYSVRRRAIRDFRWKLTDDINVGQAFYDLKNDPDEQNPLPLVGLPYERLLREMVLLWGP